MSETSTLKRRWKLILNIVTILALVALVFFIRDQLVETFRNLRRVHLWALALLLAVQWLNYHSQVKMYQGLFAVVGNKLKYRFLFRTSLELNFVNHVFPSGGVSGISYFGARLKNGQITTGRATLVQIMKLVLYIISFEGLLVVALLFMAIGNRVNDVVIMVTTLLATLLILATLAFMSIIGSEPRIKTTFTWLTRAVNGVIRFVTRGNRETIDILRVEHAVLDLHENYKQLRSQYWQLKWTLFWAFMANITEILTVYAVYVAFGEWVNLGAVILAYGVATFAGLVSILPGGVGIYEALMTSVLVAAGIPAATSLPVTVMYRVMSTLIQVPAGYYFYHKSLTSEQNDAERQKEMHDD